MKIITYRCFIVLMLALSQPIVGIGNELTHDVSIINLIATPSKYHNKKVRLQGFLTTYGLSSAIIYLSELDYKQHISKNGIWVTFPNESYANNVKANNDNRYVLLEGKFDEHKKGHFGVYSGLLFDITRLENWPIKAKIIDNTQK